MASDLPVLFQALNIIFLGDKSGKGTFFPEGVLGRIKTGEGFDQLASGVENFPIWPKKAPQVLSSPCCAFGTSERLYAIFAFCL